MRERALVVGGRSLQAVYPESWLLDPAAPSWRQLEGVAPPVLFGCALVFAPARDAFFLFGGIGETAALDETWRFDAAAETWARVDAPGPPGRYDGGLVSLDDGETLLLYGGGPSAIDPYFGDVWRFDTAAAAWTELVPTAGAPPGRRYPWMVALPDDSGFLAGFGARGIGGDDELGDLFRFELATTTFHGIELEGAPPGRGFSARLPGPPGSIGVVFGGWDGEGPVADEWVLWAASDDDRWR